MSKDYLTQDSKARKQTPMAAGLLDYFPAALAAVAEHSFFGNEKHNPGQPLHWSRQNSADHADCIVRHVVERGGFDAEGRRHSAALAWRALALLQEELEAEGATPGRGSRFPEATKSAEVLDTPVDRILGGRPEAGFKSFSDFEEQKDVKGLVNARMIDAHVGLDKRPLTEAEMLKAVQAALGPDTLVITDPREWYALTGSWPEGVVKTGADENWIAEYDFYAGSQFELTPKAKKAIGINKVKSRSSGRKAAAKAVPVKRKAAAPKPVRKR